MHIDIYLTYNDKSTLSGLVIWLFSMKSLQGV